MSHSPFANMTEQEAASRRRLLYGLLAVMGVLVVVLIGVQGAAAMRGLQFAAKSTGLDGYVQEGLNTFDASMSDIGTSVRSLQAQSEGFAAQAAIRQALFEELGATVQAAGTSDDPPGTEVEEGGAETEQAPVADESPETPAQEDTQPATQEEPETESMPATGGGDWTFNQTEEEVEQ